MPIPTFQKLIMPLLAFASDGNEHPLGAAVARLADQFGLTEAERNELLASGQTIIYNRVAWARTYMGKSGLLETARRGIFRITDVGVGVLSTPFHNYGDVFGGAVTQQR